MAPTTPAPTTSAPTTFNPTTATPTTNEPTMIPITYTTITGTWNDDYIPSPPEGWNANIDGTDYEDKTMVSSDTSYSYHMFTGEGDSNAEFYELEQQFYCNDASSVTVSYNIYFCSTEDTDYVRLYLGGDLKEETSVATTYTSSSPGTDPVAWIDTDLSSICTDSGGWETVDRFGPYTIASVDVNTLFSVQFQVRVNYPTEAIALSGIEITCNEFTTANPTNPPTSAQPTFAPTTAEPTTLNPTSNPTTNTPTTSTPTTSAPTTSNPTSNPTTSSPTTKQPSSSPTYNPTTSNPTTSNPTTSEPTNSPTTESPTTAHPTNAPTTSYPTTSEPTANPTTPHPTNKPTTPHPTDGPTEGGGGGIATSKIVETENTDSSDSVNVNNESADRLS
eukprot:472793_1